MLQTTDYGLRTCALFRIEVFAGHRYMKSFQGRVTQIIRPQAVRPDTEADHRTVRRLAGTHRGLAADDQPLDGFQQGVAAILPRRQLRRLDALSGRMQDEG